MSTAVPAQLCHHPGQPGIQILLPLMFCQQFSAQAVDCVDSFVNVCDKGLCVACQVSQRASQGMTAQPVSKVGQGMTAQPVSKVSQGMTAQPVSPGMDKVDVQLRHMHKTSSMTRCHQQLLPLCLLVLCRLDRSTTAC
jgi:hypothetical protein